MSSSNRIGDWYITINERDCAGIICREIRLTHVKNEKAELVAIELPDGLNWRVFHMGSYFSVQADQIESLIKNHTHTPFATVPYSLSAGE